MSSTCLRRRTASRSSRQPFTRDPLADHAFVRHRLFHPMRSGVKRETGGQEKSRQQSGDGDQVRANGIECGAQSLGEKVAEQSAGRQRAANVRHVDQRDFSRKRRSRRPEPISLATALPSSGCGTSASRPGRSRSETGTPRSRRTGRRDRPVRADGSDPVMHGRRADRPGRDIERRVERGIRKQAQSQQDRQAQADEADHFVEAFIFSWCKNAHKSLRLALMPPAGIADRRMQKALDGQAGKALAPCGSRGHWRAEPKRRNASAPTTIANKIAG